MAQAQANLSHIYTDLNSVPGPSRRSSIESVLSIQGKETDVVRDTSDSDWDSDEDDDVEFEPAGSGPEDCRILCENSSEQSDMDVILTEVVEVPVGDDGVLGLADSEQTDSEAVDEELSPHDYWQCAQCNARNNNPLYRYCEKCFKERKSLFPPRPKRKRKSRSTRTKRAPIESPVSKDSDSESSYDDHGAGVVVTLREAKARHEGSAECSQGSSGGSVTSDSGVGSISNSQEKEALDYFVASDVYVRNRVEVDDSSCRRRLKRCAGSVDQNAKRARSDHDAESGGDSKKDEQVRVQSLAAASRSASHPLIGGDKDSMAKRAAMNSYREKSASHDNLCIMCYSEPKTGVFTHGKIAHICCCYKCAMKAWSLGRRCPVCNCKVSNVLKAVVM